MGNSIFKRGYSASRVEKERQDKARENMGKRLWTFFLKNDGDEARVHFLTEDPVNFYQHNVKTPDGRFNQITCTGDDCPLCADGDKPTFKGAYLIVDETEREYTDKNGNKQTAKNQVKLYIAGMRIISQLDRIHSRKGLSNRDLTIARLGSGTQTTYSFEDEGENKFTEKEIESFLPEKLRGDYDGTVDSLMDIVEEQLMMMTQGYTPDNDDSDSDTEEESAGGRDKLIQYDDDSEEEESSFPMNKPESGKLKPTKKKSMFKRSESSLKPKAKTLMRSQK